MHALISTRYKSNNITCSVEFYAHSEHSTLFSPFPSSPPSLSCRVRSQAMKNLCDFKIHINCHYTFFLQQSILCSFSGRLKKMVKSGKRRSVIRVIDFPGGPESFEMVLRFCYNNGRIHISHSNICILHCAAIFLEMNEEAAISNLLSQTETFLDGLFYWTWDDIITSLKSCESFFDTAVSSGLLQKLISCLLVKISANSDIPLNAPSQIQSSPSSSSSTDASGFRCSSIKTPEVMKPCFSREWWFDDLTVLGPCIIEKIVSELGSIGSDNRNLIITRFLLQYLKSAQQRNYKIGYRGIADTAVDGVLIAAGRNVFSCRGLFWVLRVVARVELGQESREKLEWLIGSMIDKATLDDLLVSGYNEGIYDVNLVIRLLRVFFSEEGEVPLQRMKKVGRLVEKYLREISPDPSLKVSKFLAVAESLPDSARDLYDGVYRALDIYLESHPNIPFEERTRLCRCMNYEKLTLEACKDLAKNPRIPPGVAVQALVSQQSKVQIRTNMVNAIETRSWNSAKISWRTNSQQRLAEYSNEKEISAFDLQKMQKRVIELEKVCKEMRGQMSKLVGGSYITAPPYYSSRGMPKLC